LPLSRRSATLLLLSLSGCSPLDGPNLEPTGLFDPTPFSSPASPGIALNADRQTMALVSRYPYEVPPPPPLRSVATDARDSIEAALYLYASALEAHFADNNSYPTTAGVLRWYHGRPDPQVKVFLRSFGSEGYALIGRHPKWPGASCVVLTAHSDHAPLLRTDRDKQAAPADGWEPVCDTLSTHDAT
jgi:hypothetical protein